MPSDRPAALAAASEQLRAETTVPGLLGAAARTYVEILQARACTISRVIGDLLVDLVQHRQQGPADRLGHGYLISDYPLTRAVIEDRGARTVSLGDPDADPAEANLLRELGFDSLVMVAIAGAGDGPWGLVEVYGEQGRRFEDEDVLLAQELAGEVSQRLAHLERPPQV
jgi:GAF domain-containing protein